MTQVALVYRVGRAKPPISIQGRGPRAGVVGFLGGEGAASYRSLGSSVSYHSGVWGRAPAAKRFCAFWGQKLS